MPYYEGGPRIGGFCPCSISGVSGTLEKVATLWTETANSWTSLVLDHDNQLPANQVKLPLTSVFSMQVLNAIRRETTGSSNLPGFKLNSNFVVKSENLASYAGSTILTRLPLQLAPSAFCPDIAKHQQMLEQTPLPVSCPTCWSVQRIGEISF